VIREPAVIGSMGPAAISSQWQSQLSQKGLKTSSRAPSLCVCDRFEDLRLLGGRVAMVRRNYQRPFFSCKFSLVISAMTSRRR
jgi:hypothetical protein